MHIYSGYWKRRQPKTLAVSGHYELLHTCTEFISSVLNIKHSYWTIFPTVLY